MKYKKGFEIQALIGLGITFVVIAIVLSFGATILKNMQEGQVEGTTQWIYNETVSSLGNDTKTILAGGHGLIDVAWIQTGAYLINVTGVGDANSTAIIIYNDGYAAITSQHDEGGWGNDTDFQVTYSYSYTIGNADYNASEYGMDSVSEFASWLPTLAIIIIAAVIIGIIIRYFMPFAGVRY